MKERDTETGGKDGTFKKDGWRRHAPNPRIFREQLARIIITVKSSDRFQTLGSPFDRVVVTRGSNVEHSRDRWCVKCVR